MAKKVLILLCALALTVGICLLSVNATAPEKAENYVCQCCGKAYSAVNWQPWTLTEGGTDHILTADGHYYLTGDVTSIKSQVRIGDGALTPAITLDLRGFTIASAKRVFGVYAGATLSIVDSVGGGKVQGAQTSASQVGGVIRVNDGATLNLYGGTVQDCATRSHEANGAAIATEGKNVTVNIAGGNVVGSAFAPLGGAIYAAQNATVNISAGSVTGGSAFSGGAIYVTGSTLNITGGTVTGGTATVEEGQDYSGCGGAIFAKNSTVTVDGGTVNGGLAYHGGAMALVSSSLELKAGQIHGSSINGYGAALHLLADITNETPVPCTVNISGGTITAPQTSGKTAITIASNAHSLNISGGEIIGAGKASAGGSAIAGQGTAATITITGGTVTGAANMAASRSGVVYSRGYLNISGGDISVTAGNGPAVYMYQGHGLLSITGDAINTLPGKVRLVDDAKVNGGSGALSVKEGLTDGLWYYRGIDAVNNLPEGGFVRSFGGGILNLQGKTVPVDVNGQTMKIRNGTFYGFDSANNTYNNDKHGTVTLDGGVLATTAYTAPTGNTYVAFTDADGKLSFHRVGMEITGVTLRTTAGKEGIYYNAQVQADASAISVVKKYGIAVTLRQAPDADAGWTEQMDTGVKRSSYAPSTLKPSAATKVNSTSVVNIIHKDNTPHQNGVNGATRIYARPYVELDGGVFVYGQVTDTTMRQVAAAVDTQWDSLNDTQKKGLFGLYEHFATTFKSWSIPNLQAAYISGDPSVNALVLAYRRDTVIAAMRAQLSILWTVDKKVVYSKRSASLGPDADYANYVAAQQAAGKTVDPLNDQIITLYPGRVYQGLPYTHASSSNDALALYATRDSNGVYNITNAHTSLFSGASSNGAEVNAAGERIGQYNVARIGNDCWDMVHFAWGEICGDITATSTSGLTPSQGIVWLGEDILLGALKANGYVTADGYDTTAPDATLIDTICKKNSRGNYVFKNISETDAEGNPIADHDVDGTRILRIGTRTQNADGSYDYQALYKTYTLLQPGDGMVQWRNGSGHAFMVSGVKVVYNSDGTINGTKSTISLLEQGSGHEERQSRTEAEFDATATAKHASHTSTNKQCKYCAGYTDETVNGMHIWKLDYCTDQTRTFKQIAEGDAMGFTCQALQTVSQPDTARASLTYAGHGFAGLFTGRVNASYRVTSATVTIAGTNGKSFRSDCIAMQDQVNSYFSLSRFLTDATCGINDSSVLTDTLPVSKDANGNLVADLTRIPAGEYTFTLTVRLNTGHQMELRTGAFQVLADGSIKEAPVPGSGPTVILPTEPEEE